MRDFRDPSQRAVASPQSARSRVTVWNIVATLLWILTILGSIVGGLTFIGGMMSATGAPQQAAAAAMGMAWVILPYCCARAVSEIDKV